MEKTIHSSQYATFLDLFREARRRAGLTQVDVAERIGATQSFVSKCERGERRIDVVELRTFCRAFGVPVHDFVAELESTLTGRRHRAKPKGSRKK